MQATDRSLEIEHSWCPGMRGRRLRVGRCPDIKPNPKMKGNSLCVRSYLADASSAGQTAQVRAGPAGDEQAAYQVVDSRAWMNLRSLLLTGEQCTDGLLAAAPLGVRPSGVSPVPGPPCQAARRAVRGDTRRVRRRARAAGSGGGSPGRKVRQYGRTAPTQSQSCQRDCHSSLIAWLHSVFVNVMTIDVYTP
jgi:hypothetical protein